jgi:hypothetical protein
MFLGDRNSTCLSSRYQFQLIKSHGYVDNAQKAYEHHQGLTDKDIQVYGKCGALSRMATGNGATVHRKGGPGAVIS